MSDFEIWLLTVAAIALVASVALKIGDLRKEALLKRVIVYLSEVEPSPKIKGWKFIGDELHVYTRETEKYVFFPKGDSFTAEKVTTVTEATS